MARKIFAVFTPGKYDDDEVQTLADTIVAQQTANLSGVFTTPIPPLADIDAAKADLIAAQAQRQAVHGGKDNTALVKQKRKILDAKITTNRDYVNTLIGSSSIIVNGVDVTAETIVDDSGFPRNDQPNAQGTLPAATNLRALISNTIVAGSFRLAWDSLGRRVTYQVTIRSLGGTAEYEQVFTTTKAKIEPTGLQSGGLYEVVVRGINASGLGVATPPLQVRAF